MRAFWSIVTLAFGGVILADLLTHPTGVYYAGNAINSILAVTFGNMLGQPTQPSPGPAPPAGTP